MYWIQIKVGIVLQNKAGLFSVSFVLYNVINYPTTPPCRWGKDAANYIPYSEARSSHPNKGDVLCMTLN